MIIKSDYPQRIQKSPQKKICSLNCPLLSSKLKKLSNVKKSQIRLFLLLNKISWKVIMRLMACGKLLKRSVKYPKLNKNPLNDLVQLKSSILSASLEFSLIGTQILSTGYQTKFIMLHIKFTNGIGIKEIGIKNKKWNEFEKINFKFS